MPGLSTTRGGTPLAVRGWWWGQEDAPGPLFFFFFFYTLAGTALEHGFMAKKPSWL